MKDALEKIADKLDKLDNRLDAVDIILARQEANMNKYNEQLEYHIQRSDSIEEYVAHLEDKFEEEIKPIRKHITMVEGALKLVGGICVLIGAALGLLQIIKMF